MKRSLITGVAVAALGLLVASTYAYGVRRRTRG